MVTTEEINAAAEASATCLLTAFLTNLAIPVEWDSRRLAGDFDLSAFNEWANSRFQEIGRAFEAATATVSPEILEAIENANAPQNLPGYHAAGWHRATATEAAIAYARAILAVKRVHDSHFEDPLERWQFLIPALSKVMAPDFDHGHIEREAAWTRAAILTGGVGKPTTKPTGRKRASKTETELKLIAAKTYKVDHPEASTVEVADAIGVARQTLEGKPEWGDWCMKVEAAATSGRLSTLKASLDARTGQFVARQDG